MLRERANLVSAATVLADVTALVCANLAAISVLQYVHDAPMPVPREFLSHAALFTTIPVFVLCFRLGGLYGSMRTRSLKDEFALLLRASGLAAAGSIVCLFVVQPRTVSRLDFAVTLGIALPLVFSLRAACRLYLRWLRARGRNYRNYVVVGNGPRTLEIAVRLQRNPDWGIRVVGIVSETPQTITASNDYPVLGSLDDFRKVTQEHVVDVAIFVSGEQQSSAMLQALDYCRLAGIETAVEISPAPTFRGRVRVQELEGCPLLHFSQTLDNEYQLLLKRAFDIVCSLAGLVVAAPVLAAVAVLIRITSPGPILFKQIRVGTHGRRFMLYKFRTMVVNAEELRSQIAALNEMDGPVFKVRKDPRITSIGRYLRKASLDELPQLWNVLLGDMSIVGPRPPLPSEVNMYDIWHLRRLSVKPGLTCLWQVSGRNSVDFQTWMTLDLKYIDSWSWWLDLKIIALTVPAMLKGQ